MTGIDHRRRMPGHGAEIGGVRVEGIAKGADGRHVGAHAGFSAGMWLQDARRTRSVP